MTPLGMATAPEAVMEVDSGSEPSGAESGNGMGNGDDTTAFVDFTMNALGDGFDVDSHCYGLDFGDLSAGARSLDVVRRPASATNSIWDGLASIPTTTTTPLEPDHPPAPMVSYDCEAEAFTALHSLHSCTMLNTEHPGEVKHSPTRTPTSFGGVTDHMPPLDKVLYFNRSAVNTLKELLDAPGVQQPHLALLYMTIASKVLFWYRLVVSSQYKPKSGEAPSPGSDSAHSSIGGQFSAGSTTSTGSDRAVKPVSIQIGLFDLEDEDQKLLMKGVLLREVRKLESVVDKMKKLGEKYSRDDEYHDEEHISNWYAVAGSKMQAEVQDTLRQIKQFGAGIGGRDR